MRFRRLAGMALLLACMAAYWLHFEQRFAELEAETALKDPAGQLSAPDRERLLALRAALQRDFGVTARLAVRVPDDDAPPTAVPGNILYMAVTPQTGGAVVLLPSLLARALTSADVPDPERRLAEQLNACVRRTTAGTCLQNALLDMLVALGEPGSGQSSAEPASKQAVEKLQPARPPSSPGSVRGPLRTTPPTPLSDSAD